MLDIIKLAMQKGFKHEALVVLNLDNTPSDEFLVRFYSDQGDITTRLTRQQIKELGLTVLE